jgi:hypothetical protein
LKFKRFHGTSGYGLRDAVVPEMDFDIRIRTVEFSSAILGTPANESPANAELEMGLHVIPSADG